MGKLLLGKRARVYAGVLALVVASCVAISSGISHVGASTGATALLRAHVSANGGAVTALDCNGDSPVQKMFRPMNCTDIAGNLGASNPDTWGGKFYDNGQYIGHDEPDAAFTSHVPGSGNDVNWNLTLGTDPRALPTTSRPGHDVSHWFELSPAPWLSMAMCDNFSFPVTPCTPQSDSNATTSTNPGGGSAFMEMQFYPPGEPPFVDSTSCDDTHWCAALTIDSLECNATTCNNNCIEPVNFAFIQTDGVPDQNGLTPDDKTLLMNPGDQISVHMSNAPATGGGNAFQVQITDRTTHQSGSMQASAANGFVHTSIADCSQTPYNFQPEYNTASQNNIVPWAALQVDVSTEFETGHFEPCTSLTTSIGTNPFDPADPNGTMGECVGSYESAPSSTETSTETLDAMCYHLGDTHPGYAGPGTSTAPDEVTGCQDNLTQNGDLDFDGSPYWPEWPTSTQPGINPGSFVEQMPNSGGHAYSKYFFQTDVALSETPCTPTTLSGCTVPPVGPGGFYPFWSVTSGNGGCALEFGNVTRGSVNDFGGDSQYGTNQYSSIGYPEFEGPLHSTNCSNGQGGNDQAAST
ncbi:MAG TPA: hypothetical protein VNT80_01410 [Acidimicrobiales bacterium]|nr:hypothetical protein [Acidimicrobiales bacterium]